MGSKRKKNARDSRMMRSVMISDSLPYFRQEPQSSADATGQNKYGNSQKTVPSLQFLEQARPHEQSPMLQKRLAGIPEIAGPMHLQS
jgi:hypothetical protein